MNVMNEISCLTEELNAISDEASRSVREIEQALSGTGISTSVNVSKTEDGAQIVLSYDRFVNSSFRIVVTVGSERRAWSEWDRTMKLESYRCLPDLLNKIKAQLRAKVERYKKEK